MTNPPNRLSMLTDIHKQITDWGAWVLKARPFALHQSGLDLKSFGIAVILSGLTYLLMNLWLTRSVDSTYRYAKATPITSISSTEQRAVKLVKLIGGDPRFEGEAFLKESLKTLPADATWRDVILGTIVGVQNSIPDGFTQKLDEHMTGQRTGLPFLYLGIQPVSGSTIVEEFRTISPTWTSKNALFEGDGAQIKAPDIDVLLGKLIDRVSQENRPQIRSLMRISGWVQWLTVLLMWFILVLVLKRYWLFECADNSTTSDTETPRRQAYGTFDFMIGLLPSLGFVGTVLGMGDALLTADGLFSSADKTQAISVITKHLGFAFDTTLIGLVTAMICGAAVLALRTWESNELRSRG